MKKHSSFRQKLGGAFALLLSFILLQGAVSWFALTEINARFSELRDVERIIELTLDARLNEKTYVKTGERRFAVTVAGRAAAGRGHGTRNPPAVFA